MQWKNRKAMGMNVQNFKRRKIWLSDCLRSYTEFREIAIYDSGVSSRSDKHVWNYYFKQKSTLFGNSSFMDWLWTGRYLESRLWAAWSPVGYVALKAIKAAFCSPRLYSESQWRWRIRYNGVNVCARGEAASFLVERDRLPVYTTIIYTSYCAPEYSAGHALMSGYYAPADFHLETYPLNQLRWCGLMRLASNYSRPFDVSVSMHYNLYKFVS